MLQNSIVAKQIAKATLRWARSNQEDFDDLRRNLVDLLSLLQEPVWNTFVRSPSITDEEKWIQLQKIYQIESLALQSAGALLVQKKQMSQFRFVVHQMIRQQWGCVDVVVAFPIVSQKMIREEIAKNYGATCEVNVIVEASILGGCILLDGEKKVDMSVIGSLQRIQQSLYRFSRGNNAWAGI